MHDSLFPHDTLEREEALGGLLAGFFLIYVLCVTVNFSLKG